MQSMFHVLGAAGGDHGKTNRRGFAVSPCLAQVQLQSNLRVLRHHEPWPSREAEALPARLANRHTPFEMGSDEVESVADRSNSSTGKKAGELSRAPTE